MKRPAPVVKREAEEDWGWRGGWVCFWVRRRALARRPVRRQDAGAFEHRRPLGRYFRIEGIRTLGRGLDAQAKAP
jgi:hypothetical protein